MRRDVILTGIPRAGTTLATALLDAAPNTLCLNEPSWHHAGMASDAQTFAAALQEDFARLREYILHGGEVPDRRAADGSAITNYFSVSDAGIMQHHYEMLPPSPRPLTEDFTLAIKHNAPYIAVLPELIECRQFSILAIIRHPLPVIASWRRLSLPISRGDLPNAKIYWPALRAITDSTMPLLEKQVRIYEMLLARLVQYEPRITLLHYEALTQNPALLYDALGCTNAAPPQLVEQHYIHRTIEPQDAEIITQALRNYAPLACDFWAV